jgi:small-conductance mechanosensitive channel
MTLVAAARVPPLSDFDLWAKTSGLEIILFVTGAILLTRITSWLGGRIINRIELNDDETDELVRSEEAKNRHAAAQVITWVSIVLIYCIAAILIIERFGIPLTGFVVPASVAGVAIGFGAQRVVQDILSGFFIIVERQYGFGDVVRLNATGVTGAVTGTIEEVTLRVTRMRSLNGEVIITPNGQIVQVTNLSRDWARALIDVPVPGGTDVKFVTDILKRVGTAAFADEDLHPLLLDPPSVMGVESIDVDQFTVRVVARTLPGKQFDVGRDLRARITQAFADAGITITAGLDTDQPTAAG